MELALGLRIQDIQATFNSRNRWGRRWDWLYKIMIRIMIAWWRAWFVSRHMIWTTCQAEVFILALHEKVHKALSRMIQKVKDAVKVPVKIGFENSQHLTQPQWSIFLIPHRVSSQKWFASHGNVPHAFRDFSPQFRASQVARNTGDEQPERWISKGLKKERGNMSLILNTI